VAVLTLKPIRGHRSATAPSTQGSSSAMSILEATLLDLNLSIAPTSTLAYGRPFLLEASNHRRYPGSGNTASVNAPLGGRCSASIKPMLTNAALRTVWVAIRHGQSRFATMISELPSPTGRRDRKKVCVFVAIWQTNGHAGCIFGNLPAGADDRETGRAPA
jgi:hypothetical protein